MENLFDILAEVLPDRSPSPLDALIDNETVFDLFEGLTCKQETCLYWKLRGYKQVEIADIINVEPHTVSKHIKKAGDVIGRNLRKLE